MRILDRLFHRKAEVRTMADPVFGSLTANKFGSWEGTCILKGREAVLIVRSIGEPTDSQRQVFRELEARYETIQPQLGAALFELWKPWLENIPEQDRTSLHPRSAQEMLASTVLETVWIEPDAKLMLTFGFSADGIWDDAGFNVSLEDWVPRPAGIDD